MPRPFPKRISQIQPILGNVALTSHYMVEFGIHQKTLRDYLRDRGMDSRYVTETMGLLCSRAQLPGSGLATADIVGNYQGVSEKMAHSRIFTRMSMEFYVDNSYRSLKFLEHWMEYIASGSTTGRDRVSYNNENYYYRMRYPSEYKSDETRITKFEKDYKRYVEYRFWGLFPISLDSTTVSYEGSNILKATAQFHFDRYVSGQSRSINVFNRTDNDRDQSPSGTGNGGQGDTSGGSTSGATTADGTLSFGNRFNSILNSDLVSQLPKSLFNTTLSNNQVEKGYIGDRII